MTIRAIAWDVDGTLVDSEPLHHDALFAACGKWGVDISDISDDEFRGVHMGDVWRALAPRMPASAREADWVQANDDYYVKHRNLLVPMPRAVETVRQLAQAGIAQICVSNASRLILDANIDALGLQDVIEFSISIDDVGHGKPHPEPYATGCTRFGLKPHEVAAIEDSATGRRSARAAGLLVIAYDHLNEGVTDADHAIRDLALLPGLIRAHPAASIGVELEGTGGA
ncbi:HAD family hydrolase [Taklimakanibacter lacteus]|uniref:HAD family hydrolase n=1 Tax=Taklimakanibacter lacteus TaxID=2268456 RepID=UPI000E66CEC7